MDCLTEYLLKTFVFILISVKVIGLQCWYCVGLDCDDGVTNSKFSYTQECEEGQMCQKTFMYVLDVESETTSRSISVRSCSFTDDCVETDEVHSYDCQLWNWKLEAGLGCTQRWCCNNTDLCNGTTKRITAHQLQIILPVILIAKFFIH